MNKKKSLKREKKIILRRSKFGTKVSHELLVLKTNKNISVSLIDLSSYRVIFTKSSLSLSKDKVKKMSGTEIGSEIGKIAKAECDKLSLKPVKEIAINIAEYKYIGRVKALIDNFIN